VSISPLRASLLIGLAALVAAPLLAEGSPTSDRKTGVREPTPPVAVLARAQSGPRTGAARAHEPATEPSFKRFVRQFASDALDENSQLTDRSAWLWYRLTYPTGKLPRDPWGRAAEYIRRFVPDAQPWPLVGSPLIPYSQMSPDAVIDPTVDTWVEFGPRPLDSTGTTNNAYQYGIVAGRLNTIVSDPNDYGAGAGDRAWIGFAAGGLWKIEGIRSVDCSVSPCDVSGVTATSMWDSLISTTQGVSAIELDPTDTTGDTLYVGTGDWQANDQFSAGILKTTDGGATWSLLGGDVFTSYSNTVPPDAAHGGCGTCTGNRWSNQNVKEIKVDPHDSQTVLVGTRYDLYISHDAGQSWQICPFGNNYTNAEGTIGGIAAINRISGMYLDARQNPTRAYVGVGYPAQPNQQDNGVYAFDIPSTGCPSWPSDFTPFFSGFPTGTGTGTSLTGRIELAGHVDSDNLLTLYAQVSDSTTYAVQGTYVLRQGSSSWTLLTGSSSTSYRDCANQASSTGQDWYDLYIRAHPTTDRLLYLGHIDAFKTQVNSTYSSLGLSSSSNITNVYRTSCSSYGKVHPDQHGFAFVEMPGDPNYGNWILLADDGGIFLNTNAGDATKWVSLSKAGIGTNEFYAGQIGMDFGDANGDGNRGNPNDGKQWLFGGMQDNGSATWDSSRPDLQWTGRSVGGDGFWTAFDSLGGTLSSGYWITEYTYGSMNCSSSGAAGPFGTGNCGPSFSGESPDWSTPFVMDQFHCTNTQCRDVVAGGDSVWGSTAYGTPSWMKLGTTVMPGTVGAGSIVSIAIAPSEPKAVLAGTDNGKWWWTENGFSGGNCTHANRDTSAFACTANGSTTWRQIDASNTVLPNRVVGGVAFDPTNHDIVYAAVGGFSENTPGTPGHLFRAVWNGSSFTIQNKSGNLPDVPAQSVAVNPHNPNQVFLGTFFGFFYTDDVTATNPVWVRYMPGLPNAPIYHLTIDRGPFGDSLNSTTLAAFTYGRGVFAIKLPGAGESFCSNSTQPPGNVVATATADNEITVAWDDSPSSGVANYRVYRATVSGGPYTLVGTVPDTGSGPYAFPDDTVSGGTTYFYVVRAVTSGGCESSDSTESSATATGACTLPPGFAGLQSVTNLGGGQGCGLRLTWNAASETCGTPVTYAIYRSTTSGFTPGSSNLIQSCVSGTSWDDTTMPLDSTAYYVVRAEDGAASGGGPCNGGDIDSNTVRKNGYASSNGKIRIYWNDFETDSGLSDWSTGYFTGDASDWRGIQSCSANSGTHIFRFGGATCATNYSNGKFAFAQPGGSTGVQVPSGATSVELSFWHRWSFQASDGALLLVSLDGQNYYYVPASMVLAGPYTGTANGQSAWTGTQSTFVNSIVDLDAMCVAIGVPGGCAGQSVRIGFAGYSNNANNNLGWFLDDVEVTQDGPPACTAAPQPVQFLTATGKDQQVTVEWLDPASGPFSVARLRTSTSGYPADPTSGTLLVDEPGNDNDKEAYVHSTGGGSNGVVQYYSAFANSGANVYSARRTIAGLPVSTAGALKWNFSTPASALAPPIQGRGLGVFVPSNDRAFYDLAVGSGGGTWKSGYVPAAMNAPAQSSPIVMLAGDTGLPHDAAFVGSQDGHVYCFNAATGAGCTGWPAGGRSTGGFGMVQTQPMFDPGTGRLLFGSRNATGTNGFYAVNVLDGSTAWSFTNTVPQGGDGQAMGIVSGPALILGSRVVFAGRARSGGSAHSVWALDFGAGSASLAWSRDLGDIDGAPTQDWNLNHVVVGTNSGAVYALDPSNGSTVWSRSFGDGAVKSFVYYDPTTARLEFATDTTVRAIPADGTTASDWSVGGLVSPTRPILHYGTSRTYLGACAAAGCADGRVVELDAANGWATPKTYDLAGFGGLGPVTIDRSQSPALLHAGSRSGRVVAVELPLP
jgi:hypothetical protein